MKEGMPLLNTLSPVEESTQVPAIVVDAEVVSGTSYTGRVVSVETGYCFIGDVHRGLETINTNGDVFCPSGNFNVGELASFTQLNPDQSRPQKFRTEAAALIPNSLEATDKEIMALTIHALSKNRNKYHDRAKQVSSEDSEQAARNLPFEHMLLMEQFSKSKENFSDDDVISLAERFLERSFSSLAAYGLSSALYQDEALIEKERSIMEEAVNDSKSCGLKNQAAALNDEYQYFSGIRNIFGLMHDRDMLRLDSVIPIHYLPELLVVSPVWFIGSRNDLPNNTTEDDPRPDLAVKFFCNTVGTKEFSWLYQIYNRRTRKLSDFDGRDIMPPNILKIVKSAQETFDFVVIATPYHDLASKEWADPEWLSNIDPFLLGFKQGLPYMFLLGRWSRTGLFPLVCDMIADTINHLRLNHERLSNFPSTSWWHNGLRQNDVGVGHVLTASMGDRNTVLKPFALEVIKAFDEGRLFSFLRGERPLKNIT